VTGQTTATSVPEGTLRPMTPTAPALHTSPAPAPRPTRLGTVFLPSHPATPVGRFSFIVDKETGAEVVIGTPVAADTVEGVVIGTVTDLVTVGTDRDALTADMRPTDPGFAPVASREDVVVAEVQVFHAPAMRPVRSGTVRPATADEVALAAGMDRIEWPIPAGVVELSDGTYAPICLDGHTLTGPESAHLTISGLSGQAAKTSFAGVLLRSVIHAGSPSRDSVGAIVFNVKGQDLVNLDQPPAAGYELSDDDLAMYRAMGIPATPFEDVTVYAPSLPGGVGTRSSRVNAEPLRWDLKLIWPYLRYFFPGLYENDNMAAFLGDFESIHLRNENAGRRLDTFDKLENWLDSELQDIEDSGRSEGWRDHHVATMRRARKLLMSLPERCGGLLTTGKAKPSDDIPVEDWRHGQVVVVDIAGLEPIVQSAVIARTAQRLLASAESDRLGVDHLVLFADELNLFAPAQGGDLVPVKKILQKISATGRYAGLSLWGAGQMLSQVDSQIIANAATRAIGIVSEAELDTGVYGRMPAGQRERIVTLPKGQMSLKAYNLRGQVVVKFPRPAWATGRAKNVGRPRPDITAALALSKASVERLTEGLDPDVVQAVIARHDDRDAAIAELERLRHPDMSRMSVETGSTYDADNPFALEDLE